jgi:deoxyribodipyrimidine photo-lyase
MDSYPEANLRHYRFMLEGLAETQHLLTRRRIGWWCEKARRRKWLPMACKAAALLVCDVGYTRHQRRWRETVSREVPCRTVAVEGDVVVPVAVGIAESRVCRPHHSTQDQPASTTLSGALPPVSTQTASVELRVDGWIFPASKQSWMAWTSTRSVPAVPRFSKGRSGRGQSAGCGDSLPTALNVMTPTATSPRPTISPT